MDNEVKTATELYDLLTADERQFVIDLLRALSSNQSSSDDYSNSEMKTV